MAKDSNRRCSHCGNNGHNSRTCNDRGLKLFGVRIKGEGEVVIRKSMSMGNLASFAAEQNSNDHGYLSDGLVNSSTIRNERKRGVPWTEEEHRTFLAGLEKLGKGDWRGISKNFVTTRTPTQVASHAQKYFLRQVAPKKTKRRLSLFDLVSNDTGVSADTSPTFSLGRTGEAQEENHLHSNCYSAGSSCGIKNPVIDGASEISATLSLGTKHEISDSCLSDFLQLSFSQAPGFSPESYPHWTSKVTQFPVPSAKSLSLENGDLELSIAPPRPDNPFKFVSPIINVAGIVRVV